MRPADLLFDASSLLELGFSEEEALERLAQDAPPALATALAESRRKGSLADCAWLPERTRTLLRHSGDDLPATLRLAARMERGRELQLRSIERTLAYPRMVFFAFLGFLAIWMTLVLPMLHHLMETFHARMPLLTRVVLDLSKSPWTVLLLVLIGAAVQILLSTSPRGDFARLRLPWIGRFVKSQQTLLWLRWLEGQLAQGLPLVEATREAAAVCTSPSFRKSMEGVAEELARGGQLGPAVKEVPYVPGLTAWMLEHAEGSELTRGELHRIAEALQVEVDRSFQRGIPFLEPLLLLAIGFFTISMVVTMLLPFYQMVGELG